MKRPAPSLSSSPSDEFTDIVTEVRDPNGDDPFQYHAVKNSLNTLALRSGTVLEMETPFHPSDVARAVVDQGNIGGIVSSPYEKEICDDVDESEVVGGSKVDDESADFYAFYSILNISQHWEIMGKFIEGLRLHPKVADTPLINYLRDLRQLSDDELTSERRVKPAIGFFIFERMLNIPLYVIRNAYSGLLEDVKWSMFTANEAEDGMTESERKFYNFEEVLAVFLCTVPSSKMRNEGKDTLSLKDIAFYHPDHEILCRKSRHWVVLPIEDSKVEMCFPSSDSKKGPSKKKRQSMDGRECLTVVILNWKSFKSVSQAVQLLQEGPLYKFDD